MSRLTGRRKDDAGRPNPDAPILVVTGMKQEAACVAGEGVITVCSGADVGRLHDALDRLVETEFSCVVSFGLAGGLDYALRPGDLMVADTIVGGALREFARPEPAELVAAGDVALVERRAPPARRIGIPRREAHRRFVDVFMEGAATAGCRTVTGAIVGVDQPAMDTSAKTHLRETMKAQAVDMESHIGIEFAEMRGLPFVAVRAISDPAARALPPLAASALTPEGDVNVMKVAREIFRAPDQLPGLILAGLDSRAAFTSLRRCGLLLRPLSRLVLADL